MKAYVLFAIALAANSALSLAAETLMETAIAIWLSWTRSPASTALVINSNLELSPGSKTDREALKASRASRSGSCSQTISMRSDLRLPTPTKLQWWTSRVPLVLPDPSMSPSTPVSAQTPWWQLTLADQTIPVWTICSSPASTTHPNQISPACFAMTAPNSQSLSKHH